MHDSFNQILNAIPHRPPMLLIDAILSQNKTSIVCQKLFREDEFYFLGHYPDFSLVPGVILCECAAQAGAILLSTMIPPGAAIPVLTRMNDVKFKNMVRPGDTIEISVRLEEVVSSAYFLVAQVKVGAKIAARLNFACTVAERN